MAGLDDARAKGELALGSVGVGLAERAAELRGVRIGRSRRRSFKGVEHQISVGTVQRSG
jgi:hypothetical protein